MTALAYAIEAITIIPKLVAAGIDIVDFVNETTDSMKKMQAENRDPNDAEWDALNKVVEDLLAQRPEV